MSRILLVLAIVSLLGSLYFFFAVRYLFYGSLTILLSVAFSIMYAMLSNVNRLPDGVINDDDRE